MDDDYFEIVATTAREIALCPDWRYYHRERIVYPRCATGFALALIEGDSDDLAVEWDRERHWRWYALTGDEQDRLRMAVLDG